MIMMRAFMVCTWDLADMQPLMIWFIALQTSGIKRSIYTRENAIINIMHNAVHIIMLYCLRMKTAV